MATLTELKDKIISQLAHLGIQQSECRRESELIAEHATGWSLAQQILNAGEQLPDGPAKVIEQILLKRRNRVPLQYALGYTWFMGFQFMVRPGVFIPRADTECLVEVARKRLSRIKDPVGLEIGTGSGAIALSLLKLIPSLTLTGIEISKRALELTRDNAEHHRLSHRLKLIAGPWLDNLSKPLDAIISNPPYIPLTIKETLPPEVVDHEPHQALFGGDDGLDFYRLLSKNGLSHLKSGGFVCLEIGDLQSESVSEIFQKADWRGIEIHQDLSHNPRVITAHAGNHGI